MKKPKLSTLIPIIILLFLLFSRFASPNINTSWVVDAACTEVKSEVYQTYGEIPTLSGDLVYKNGQDYIVIVKFKLKDWGWSGSHACYMYGYREGNCALMDMTKELSYDHDYRVEELKALWAIN